MPTTDFSKLVPPEKWKHSRLVGRNCRWLPLVRADATKPWIGLTDSGTWVRESGSGEFSEITDSFPLPAFPLLLRDETEFYTELGRMLSANGIPAR